MFMGLYTLLVRKILRQLVNHRMFLEKYSKCKDYLLTKLVGCIPEWSGLVVMNTSEPQALGHSQPL